LNYSINAGKIKSEFASYSFWDGNGYTSFSYGFNNVPTILGQHGINIFADYPIESDLVSALKAL
jgi:hypothetical protein